MLRGWDTWRGLGLGLLVLGMLGVGGCGMKPTTPTGSVLPFQGMTLTVAAVGIAVVLRSRRLRCGPGPSMSTSGRWICRR